MAIRVEWISVHSENFIAGSRKEHNILHFWFKGNAIIAEAEKQLLEFNNSKISDSEPVVIIAGDFNSQSPFPGYNNFKAQGYTSAPEVCGFLANKIWYVTASYAYKITWQVLGKNAIPTLYYESPITLPGPGNITVDFAAIDHVFIRNADKSSGKIGVLSADAPTIGSYELSESSNIRLWLIRVLLYKCDHCALQYSADTQWRCFISLCTLNAPWKRRYLYAIVRVARIRQNYEAGRQTDRKPAKPCNEFQTLTLSEPAINSPSKLCVNLADALGFVLEGWKVTAKSWPAPYLSQNRHVACIKFPFNVQYD